MAGWKRTKVLQPKNGSCKTAPIPAAVIHMSRKINTTQNFIPVLKKRYLDEDFSRIQSNPASGLRIFTNSQRSQQSLARLSPANISYDYHINPPAFPASSFRQIHLYLRFTRPVSYKYTISSWPVAYAHVLRPMPTTFGRSHHLKICLNNSRALHEIY